MVSFFYLWLQCKWLDESDSTGIILLELTSFWWRSYSNILMTFVVKNVVYVTISFLNQFI
jgi:hypothetical protein